MIQLSERTLGDWLEYWAEHTPDKEYIVYSDRNLRFTWKQFNTRVDNMAKGLLAIGISHGTHVGIWAKNVPDWLTFLYACAKIGAVAVTVNTNYKQAELEYLCENSDMHTLCIVDGERDSNFVEMTYKMLPELKTFERGHMKSKRFPYMRNVIYIGQEKYRGMYNTAEILLLGNNIDDDCLLQAKKKVNCHDTVNMQYTSGTTGFPKGVMLTHYNIANNGFLTGEHMKFTSNDKLCVCVPLFHCFGVVLATMNCLTHGCTQVMVERFDPLVVLASVHKERCTALYGVPTMFIGTAFGYFAGSLLGLDPQFGAAIGLVATFCGVVNCPVASIILSVEIFGAHGLIFFAVAVSVSYMLSGYYGLYSSQKILYSKLKAEYININAK